MNKTFITFLLIVTMGACSCSAQTQGGGTNGGGTISRAASDVTPPTITNIQVSKTDTTATITWTTNEAANTQICRGATGGPYNTCNPAIATLGTSHSDTFTGLSASTQYFYVVKSTDAASNLRTCNSDGASGCPSGTELTFTTDAPAGNPLYGETSKTDVNVPPNYYLMEIANFSGNGSVCTVDVTATFNPHGLIANDKVKVWAGATGGTYATAANAIETVASSVDNDTFTFNCSSSASGTGGWVVKMPAWNNGDIYTEEAAYGSTPVRRIGNFETGTVYRAAYSPWYGVSPDGTKVLVAAVGGGMAILNVSDGSTFKTVSQASTASLSTENDNPRWLDNSTIIIFKYNSGQVRKWTLANSTSDLWDTIANCNAISLGQTGELDSAADKVALRCYNGTSYDWFVYTISTKTKGAIYNSGSSTGDFSQILESGDFLIFTGTPGTSGFTGTILITGSTGVYSKHVSNTNPHGTAKRAPDGNDYLFMFDNGITGSPCVGGIISVKISDLTKTCLWNVANIGTDRTLGVTSSSGANPGWVLISYQGPGSGRVFSEVNTWKTAWTNPLQAEIAYVKWDGSAVYRFVHHWGRPGAYNAYPHATMNRDGGVVIYNSWGFCNSTVAATCLPDGNNPRGLSVIKPFTNGNP